MEHFLKKIHIKHDIWQKDVFCVVSNDNRVFSSLIQLKIIVGKSKFNILFVLLTSVCWCGSHSPSVRDPVQQNEISHFAQPNSIMGMLVEIRQKKSN